MEYVPADTPDGVRMRRIAELRKLAEANADVRLSQASPCSLAHSLGTALPLILARFLVQKGFAFFASGFLSFSVFMVRV